MKTILLSLTLLFSVSKIFAQDKKTGKHDKAPAEQGYEMKQYYFVMLTKGARRNEITDTAIINRLQTEHLANIDRLAGMGKILVAGPFGDNGNWRGLFIFDCETEKEVRELLQSDPAIAAGRLDYEIHPWWTAKNCVFK